MDIRPGESLLHYRLGEKIGEGGMGEVYRATDTTLGREVALKLLPARLVADPERIARFEREAKVLASLNHSGIASIYGFHEHNGVRFLVMELATGPDLSERIAAGPMEVGEALRIATRIAEGLEYAHERNIVHRDLKPANVKVSQDSVKILDFGLAKVFAPEGRDGEPTSTPTLLPTVTSGGTGEGIILGTAAYMSPEQARGHVVDRRTDIWAFGCVLYEMLTGKRLFHEDSVTDTLAAVLRADIDLSDLPRDTPKVVRYLLERCLDRDPKTRLRDIGEARVVLADPQASTAMRIVTADAASTAKARPRMAAAAAVIASLVLGFAAGTFLLADAPPPPAPSFLFDLRDTTNTLATGSLALSPSASHLVFSRFAGEGARELCIRRLDQDAFRVIPGSTDGRYPFWSPDGTNIGFFVGNSVFRIDLDGGAARKVAELPGRPMGGAWNADDVILVGTYDGPLFRIDAAGGTPESLTTVEEGVESAHVWPAFLPDGKHFVFLADASDDEGHRLYLKSLDLKESKILRKALRSAIAVDPEGALLIVQDRQLIALPFDFGKREITGASILIENDIQTVGQRHQTPVTVSGNGVMALQRGSDEATIVHIPLDGTARKVLTESGRYRNPRVSPDGGRIAFEIQESGTERLIWVLNVERGVRTLVSDRGGFSDSPAWSPDGQWIYFSSRSEGSDWAIYRKRVFGGGAAEHLGGPAGSTDLAFEDCSRDGRRILTSSAQPDGSWGLFLGTLEADTVSWTAWASTPAQEERGRFSPDGKWIAFRSDVSGREEVYVAPTDGGPVASQWMVSMNGGGDPSWSPDGSVLYYLSPAGSLMAVSIEARDMELDAGRPKSLFELNTPEVGYLRNAYDPTPDGAAVVAFQETYHTSAAIRVRTGWREW